MGFACNRFTAILFCLTAMVVQNFGELIVLRSPEDHNAQGTGRMLTCYSEDDDSALVWNYDNQAGETNSGDDIADNFKPGQSGPEANNTCAIWNSTECMASWEKSSSWELVNSTKKPTGPVLDYRWEGFEEFVIRETEGDLKYMELGVMEEYSGTVVFSVRAFRDFDVFLCHEKDVTRGRCFWIRIGCSGGKQSKILSCVRGVPKSNDSEADRDCTDVEDTWHETTVVDGYEWRTFRVEWKSDERTIKLFNGTGVDPFLQATVKQWHSVSYVFMRSRITSRVRFHFYDYHLTRKRDAELSTGQFDSAIKDFCVEMLVGLCPNCQLKVSLVDESGQHLAMNSISGDKSSADSVPLSWKPIYLIASLKTPMPKRVQLKIETILDDNKGEGQWAVDKFHSCRSSGSLRKSTITIHKEKMSPVSWPEVKCQKLSYSKGAVVDSLSTGTIDGDTSKFLMLVRNSLTLDSYTSLGKKWSFCDPTGCACDHGYTGKDCERECNPGFYGYNCSKQCGRCSSGNCDRTHGRCTSGCQIDVLLPPMCREFERPIVEDITDTTARILQKVEPELLGYISNFRFVIRGGDGRESLIITTSFAESTYTVHIEKLHPGTMYWVYTFVSTNNNGTVTEAPSPQIISVTTLHRRFEVEPKSSDIVMRSHQDSEECEVTEPYHAKIQKRITKPHDGSFVTPYFPFTFRKLEPYNENEPTVHKTGGRIISRTRTVRSMQLVPGKVRDLHQLNVSDTSVTLQWTVPLHVDGIIVKYIVLIKRIKLLACKDLGKPTPTQDNIIAEVNVTTATFSGLNPYAKYTASVIAHTTEPGMQELIEFETPERGIPTSSVRNLELINNQARLEWDRPEDCLKITGTTKFTRLYITNLHNLAQNMTLVRRTAHKFFDVYKLYLTPYTLYNVRAYVSRNNTERVNLTLYQEKNWTTAPSAPSAMKSLDLYDADPDANTISLRWVPPNPANGEIESYHVTFDKGRQPRKWNITAMKGEEACEPWGNYVCIKNWPLPANASNVIKVRIYAKNKGVEAAGTSFTFTLHPSYDYNQAPGKPSNLTATHEGHGDVIFRWMHPSYTFTKITRFDITIGIVDSVLLEKQSTRYPMTVKCTITKNQKYYTKMVTLQPSTNYTVSVVAVNQRNQKSGAITTELLVPTSVQESNLAWLAILPVVLAACMLVVFIWHRNRKIVPRQPREPSYVEPIPAASLTTTTAVRTLPPTHQSTQVVKPSIPQRPSYLQIIPPSLTTSLTNNSITLDTLKISFHPESTGNRSSDHLYALPNELESCSVSMENFDEYTKNAASSKLLYSQYMRLRVGLTSPCEYGRLVENIPKNRSLNLIAYDDTRVILGKIRGDLHSDYINANYIKGYKKERAYIAAQGPTPNTVHDFWRMVWEQKVRAICMLTNVTEGTETKCEKYWPDIGARMKHGGFLISNIDEQVFADYTLRTLELNFKQETQKVTHLHYTGWPSLGVPKNPQSLVAYLRKLEQTPTGTGPILVHCSTGDDRTGTLILCDICLRQAVAEKAIDVMAVAVRMRNSRANMVGTLQQYVLAHIIITEISVSWPSQISCTDVLSSRMNILRSRLPVDIQRLKDTAWQQQALRSSALVGSQTSERLTDGSPEKIYDDVLEEERNQIHAVSVDGVKVNKQNLACWLPSPLTLPDFWEFVAERDIKLIIILQCSDPGNPSCCDIIPEESIVLPTLHIEMENGTSLDNGEYFTKEKLLLTDTSEENERSQTVTVLTCRGWGCGTVQKPPNPPALISLWRASERIPREEGQTLVLCHDSITGCGLYLALSFLLERMTVERECDVIAAVRAVRRSKPEYVQSMEQFEYLYDAAVNYVESFQAYANFS